MVENQSIETDVQSESFRSMALVLLAFGYFWFVVVIYPIQGVGHSAAAWIGSLTLVIFPTLSLKIYDRFYNLAPLILLGGTCVSILSGIVEFRLIELGYLFIVPVILSGVFLRKVTTTIIVLLAIVGTSLAHLFLKLPFFYLHTLFQILIILAAGLTSWFSASHLYLALAWAKSSYENARKNEQIVVEQRAELIRVLKVVDNLTYQYERANYSLQLERDRSEEARRLKQQFAQNISHELRTPLSLIVGFSQLMLESPEHYALPLSPSLIRDLSTIHRNALHLQSLTNDVLELAGIDSGKLSLTMEWIDPTELARDVIATASSLIQQKGLELNLESEPKMPRLLGDPARIRQVFFNLLNNAARFTERGDVTIRVQQYANNVLFSVQDTGIGIPPEESARIFEEFEQVKEKGKNRGGSGLGLAISRRFVEMHNGHIWVESEMGKGSTFYFTIPISKRTDPSPIESQQPAVPVSTSINDRNEMILLVVSSSPSVANLLNHRIKGGRAVAIRNFEEVETVAKRLRPQAVLWDAANQIIPDPSLINDLKSLGIPLVVCSLPGEGNFLEDYDIDGYLSKPITREILLDVMRQLGEDINSILIADDERDFIQFLVRVLDLPIRRYHVTIAESRRELIELINIQPDLVIIGLDMPKPELIDLLQQIRTRVANPNELRIIIITQNEDTARGNPIQGPITIHMPEGLQPSRFVDIIQQVIG